MAVRREEKRVKQRIFAVALYAMLFALCVSASAQQPKKVFRIGYLSSADPATDSPRVEAFRQGLRELGYSEGKNIVIEWRYAEGKPDRLPALAAELVHLKVDVIVSAAPAPTRSAKQATATIPIVMTNDGDPVGNGFVASLARPGGNITGLANFNPELTGKRLELLKEIIPQLTRVAVFGTSSTPGNAEVLRETELASRAFGAKLQYLEIRGPGDIETVFRGATKGRADAILVLSGPLLNSHRKQIVDFAAKNRLPAIYPNSFWTEVGGLMTYSVSRTDMDRRAATYVDKILKGAKPGDLAVEQPTKFELVINLTAAKQIGVIIPPNVLARADKVIK
jgi:putative ABC transport system substrate-binding protein